VQHGTDWLAIENALLKDHKEAMSKLQVVLDTLKDKVGIFRERKALILGKIRKMQGEAQQKTLEYLDRVDKLESDCSEVSGEDLSKFNIDPKSIDNFKSACSDAKNKINTFKKDVLEPILKQTSVPKDVDLEVEFSNAPLWPELEPQLQSLASAVEKAEQLGGEVLKVRIEFMKALQDLEAPLASARATMEEVEKSAHEISGRGLDETDLNAKRGAVDRLDTKLEGLQAQSKDPDGFRAAAAQFIEAVAAAKEAVDASQAELKRREAELKERKALEDQLEEISGEVNQAEATVLQKMEKMIGGSDGDDKIDIPDIHALIAETTDLRSKVYTLDVEELKEKVKQLRDKSSADVEKLKALHKEAEDKNKKKFADLKARFNNRASVAPPPVPQKLPVRTAPM